MSLNKFFDVETGINLNLKIGCENCEIENELQVNGTATLTNVVFDGDINLDNAEIENKDGSGTLSTLQLTADNITSVECFVNGATINGALGITQISEVFQLDDIVISKDDGKVNEVLTTDGQDTWSYKPFEYGNSYGYALVETKYDRASVEVQKWAPPNPNTSYYPANIVGTVISDYSSGLYSQGSENNIIIEKSGWYRVDSIIEITQEEKDASIVNIHATVLLGNIKPPQNKEIIKLYNALEPTTINFSEVVRIDTSNPVLSRSVAVGIAWNSPNPVATLPFVINSWKLSLTRISNL